ncbi:tRNA (guanine(37)-N(1))-methyltransferase isoform X1 [Rhynchophorus ferrugineus]|uniref:tRNA (guanine(37)-N(1))-methyltransferase isoform X1 n=2 Tax=Rhynchophorus ferrugineus TaxID=354439 RepID=UPI003FCD9988
MFLNCYKLFRCAISNHLNNIINIGAMDTILKPPDRVYLMQKLDRQAFEKVITVPVVNIKNCKISAVLPLLKQYLLKLEKFKPIDSTDSDNVYVYLNPECIKSWSDISEDIRTDLGNFEVNESSLILKDFILKYDHYSSEKILRAILPHHKEGLSSFTKVGHIVHVNIREHLLPYKDIIGEVLYDKVAGCKSVVNKTNIIDNTYRNFQMEVLKGENKMLTMVKENNCRFEFDFSTVYWNSRLATEHERIVQGLKSNNVLFDIFAGVGPFSLPAAKKGCKVFANDLNPESFKWLAHNKKINKVPDNNLTCYNIDGREFILTVLKDNLLKFSNENVFITMNLPAMAVEFLDAYIGLFKNFVIPESFEYVTAFVYCFAKGDNAEEIARKLILDNLQVYGVDINTKIKEIFKVRTVSSMKEMMRVKLHLDKDILVGNCTSKRKMNCQIDMENGQEQQEEECLQSGRCKKFKNES